MKQSTQKHDSQTTLVKLRDLRDDKSAKFT